jgi:hypothetical protein
MRSLKTALSVIGAVTVLVLAANTVAYAATGGTFFLGQTNKASKQTTLERTTSGAALGLVTKSSANAPLSTNGSGKVVNLNADRVDGLDSSALKTQTYRYTIPAQTAVRSFDVSFPTLPAGTYLASYDLLATVDAAGTRITCYFQDPTTSRFTMVANGAANSTGFSLSVNATGVVATSFAANLACTASGGNMTLDQDFGRTVTFTRIDALAEGTAGLARTSRASSRLLPTGH